MKYFVLVGPGLSGTNLMNDYIGKKANLQRDKDIHQDNPHTRIVPKSCPHNVLFIYADPRNILLSSVNRSVKKDLTLVPGKNASLLWLYKQCKLLGGDLDFVVKLQNARNMNVEYVLNTGYDPMGLEKHFTNWLTAKIDYKMMMLKYEALENPKTFQEVLNFFEIKESYSLEWKPRRTSYLNLPVKQQVQITKLFKNLLKIQAELPPIYIR